MQQQGFSISEAFKLGWEMWKKRWGLLLGIAIFSLVLLGIPQILQSFLPETAVFASLILGLAHLICGVIAHMGLLTIALKAARQEECIFIDFFSTLHLFPSYLWGQILFVLSVCLGLILLIIPGVVIALKFNLWPFFVLDRASKGVEALKLSNEAVYGNKWNLLLFALAAFILNLVGILCLGVGLLVTLIITNIAWASIYCKLTMSAASEPIEKRLDKNEKETR
jgi:uncharacterized membrane protein